MICNEPQLLSAKGAEVVLHPPTFDLKIQESKDAMATIMNKLDNYQNGGRLYGGSPPLSKPTNWTPPAHDELSQLLLEGLKSRLSVRKEAPVNHTNQTNQPVNSIVITDSVGQITLANGAALSIINLAELYLQGTTCEALLAEGMDCPHKAVSQEDPMVEREILSRAGDRLLNVRASRFEDSSGRVCGFMHVIHVARERALEQHLIEIERMSMAGQMVSSVAHEVATPLSVITNIAEMLLLDSERGSPTASNLKKIVTQARRVAEMTRRMLDFARQKPVQFTTIDMAELARETIDLIEYQLRKARIQISVENELNTPLVWGDRAQLQQVLLNLITNAIQAIKNSGLIAVRIADDESSKKLHHTVLLSVEDSGPGIPAQAVDRMFDFFFTTKITEGGTGLGLAISKQIIEGHGGTIAAENIKNGGARLLVGLPVALAEQVAAPLRLFSATHQPE